MRCIVALVLLAVLPIVNAVAGVDGVDAAEILPQAARQYQQQGAILVDVREDDERTQGMAEGAMGVPMSMLIAAPADYLPDPQVMVLLVCRSGQRSKRVAAQLLQQGYTQVFSVQGGTLHWQEEGLPMVFPEQ